MKNDLSLVDYFLFKVKCLNGLDTLVSFCVIETTKLNVIKKIEEYCPDEVSEDALHDLDNLKIENLGHLSDVVGIKTFIKKEYE